MAKWNTFKWSDGTKWADANGVAALYGTGVDRRGYHISLRLTHTNATYPGSLASLIILTPSIETGARSQLSNGYEAFVDRNANTQRIAIKLTHVGSLSTAFVIDRISLRTNLRSRQQPTR